MKKKPKHLIEDHSNSKPREKRDLSNNCSKDDEDTNNDCWGCNYFCFPIGCMFDEDKNSKMDGRRI